MTNPAVKRSITLEELQAHNTKEEPWFAVYGEVYDGTGFLEQHPGGAHSITLVAGEDATEDFIAIHSSDARKQLADFHIGTLADTFSGNTAHGEDDSTSRYFLNKKWKKVVLTAIEDVSSDAKIFRFALDRPDQEIGLPIGQHVYVRLRRKVKHQDVAEIVEGELVQRAYTPLSRACDRGSVDLLVKIYYPDDRYPQGGRMTLGFAELEIGDSIELKGPIGHFIWKGQGTALVDGTERRVREIGMVCGGSGITPILQVVRGIFDDELDTTTKVSILDVNRFVPDILCREELDLLVVQHPTRLRVHYSLTGNSVPAKWSYSRGRITDEMLKIHLPEPSEDKMICICGPPSMEQKIKNSLSNFGWDAGMQIVIF
jgi:nitrate reductase (NAD(P)H)